MTDPFTPIRSLADHEGETVTLAGWLYNKRGSKGLYFLILRDGTGLAQCVVNEEQVDAASFAGGRRRDAGERAPQSPAPSSPTSDRSADSRCRRRPSSC